MTQYYDRVLWIRVVAAPVDDVPSDPNETQQTATRKLILSCFHPERASKVLSQAEMELLVCIWHTLQLTTRQLGCAICITEFIPVPIQQPQDTETKPMPHGAGQGKHALDPGRRDVSASARVPMLMT